MRHADVAGDDQRTHRVGEAASRLPPPCMPPPVITSVPFDERLTTGSVVEKCTSQPPRGAIERLHLVGRPRQRMRRLGQPDPQDVHRLAGRVLDAHLARHLPRTDGDQRPELAALVVGQFPGDAIQRLGASPPKSPCRA